MPRESENLAAQRAKLGELLASHRERNGLTQRELAERMFYDRTSISKIEAGQQPAQRAFWCEADRLLSAAGELVAGYDALAAAKASDQQSDEHSSDCPADVLFEALTTAMVPVARASNRVRSTSASPEQVNTVIELQALSRTLTEHCRRVMMGEPVDWADITEQLDTAARASQCLVVVEVVEHFAVGGAERRA